MRGDTLPFVIVKVSGVDRKIWVDLHEPEGVETPLPRSIGTEVKLTPEQFASEMQPAAGFAKTQEVLLARQAQSRENLAVMARSANAFESARRKLLAGRTGRPREVFGFTQAEDFALVALHFEALGHKQAIRETLEFWKPAANNPPARRHIEAALRRVRNWVLENPYLSADAARKRWSLPELPKTRSRRVKRRAN